MYYVIVQIFLAISAKSTSDFWYLCSIKAISLCLVLHVLDVIHNL